jgi:hypothetical protein
MRRQQSRGAAVHDWSIAEALPGAAANEEMYVYTSLGLNGAWTSAALEARRPVDTSQHAVGCMNAQSPSSTPTLRPHVSEPQGKSCAFHRKQHFVPLVVTILLIYTLICTLHISIIYQIFSRKFGVIFDENLLSSSATTLRSFDRS